MNTVTSYSDLCFAHLCIRYHQYGVSALSTYYGARHVHGFSAFHSLFVMRAQLKELGSDYQGGLDCVKFRGKDRIEKLLKASTC